MGLFDSFNPIKAVSGLLGGGGGGGSSSMYSGGIGSSSGNTNTKVANTTTETSNVDRRLVIAEGGVGINSESSPITMNIYGRDASAGGGYSAGMNNATPQGSMPEQGAGGDMAAWLEENKGLAIGGAVALLVVVVIVAKVAK